MEKHSVTEHFENNFEKDPKTVLTEIHSEEQVEASSCGAAVITNILETLGKKITQKEIINEIRKDIREIRPEDSKLSMSDIGAPPEVMKKVLSRHEVTFEEKKSVSEITEKTSAESEEYLSRKLREGYVVICPIQSIPDYKEKRNIENDGHYIIVCGEMEVNGKKHFITVDSMFHYYQRLSNEGSVYRMHMGDQAGEDVPKTNEIYERDNVDTRNLVYSEDALKKFGIDPSEFKIDPSKYGYRTISAESFMHNWKDISGFGEPYNQYGIAVKMSTKFDELPQEIKDSSREVIKKSNLLGKIWKASPDEPYGLRHFNPDRSEDTQRFKDMDRQSVKWMIPSHPSSNEDLDWIMRMEETAKDYPSLTWAIVDEKGESLGWVSFYYDENMNSSRKAELGIPEDALVLELSYSKLFADWPRHSRFVKDRTNLINSQNKGVAVSGVRQGLVRIKEIEELVAQNNHESPRPVFITAYTVPTNIPSEKVLEKNGFQLGGKVDYKRVPNNFWLKKI